MQKRILVLGGTGAMGVYLGVVSAAAAAVRASALATEQRLGGPGDWVLALPAHYVAGLMVLVFRHGLRRRRATPFPPLMGDRGPQPPELSRLHYLAA